ncbi:MAG TPA: aminotransferase class V-fold PLP-dependent enzyme [Pyrinomonadaceae bacterium]|nr:aminotransferase class V-fold PLP-dependent enzyme [Pyrinomonadaceae bacterium]
MNESLRALFPLAERVVYLNHAAVSPPPTPTIEAVTAQLRDVAANGSLHYRSWMAVRERARKLAAEMLGAEAHQLAFMRNTSDGLSTIANGLSWQRGQNIVTFRREFPSNIYAWLHLRETQGVEVRFCEERDGRVDVEELIGLIDDRTRIVAISQVQYASGFRADLERIGRAARVHDALLVVDVIQGMGVLPINVEAELIDAAAGACHKWLLTPEGVGLLYLSERARERIEPTLVGWTSVTDPEDYSNFEQAWARGALPWETGTAPTALIHGLEASLHLLKKTGLECIAAHLSELTDYLCERLKGRGYEIVSSRRASEKSQVVCLHSKEGWTPMSLYAHLKKRDIIVAPRGNRLRISPHLYNTTEDIEALIDALP